MVLIYTHTNYQLCLLGEKFPLSSPHNLFVTIFPSDSPITAWPTQKGVDFLPIMADLIRGVIRGPEGLLDYLLFWPPGGSRLTGWLGGGTDRQHQGVIRGMPPITG